MSSNIVCLISLNAPIHCGPHPSNIQSITCTKCSLTNSFPAIFFRKLPLLCPSCSTPNHASFYYVPHRVCWSCSAHTLLFGHCPQHTNTGYSGCCHKCNFPFDSSCGIVWYFLKKETLFDPDGTAVERDITTDQMEGCEFEVVEERWRKGNRVWREQVRCRDSGKRIRVALEVVPCRSCEVCASGELADNMKIRWNIDGIRMEWDGDVLMGEQEQEEEL